MSAAALQAGLHSLGLALDAAQQQQLLDYLTLVHKWNQVYNLTAVRNPADMLTQHLLDCLAVIPPLRRHTGGRPARLLDVGSGAGLPGVVIAICCPEIEVCCVDTVSKKAAFVQQAAGALKLPNLRGQHARVEQLADAPFDLVSSRAFSSLADLVALSAQHLRPATTSQPGGVWMAMKGKHPTDELAALPATVQVFHVEPLRVPGLDAERCLVWLRPAA